MLEQIDINALSNIPPRVDPEEYLACVLTAAMELDGAALDCLNQLALHGPAEANNLPSKTGVGYLIAKGMAVEIGIKDTFGYIALTCDGHNVYNVNKTRSRLAQQAIALNFMMDGPAFTIAGIDERTATDGEITRLEDSVKLAIAVADNAFDVLEQLVVAGPLHAGNIVSREQRSYLVKHNLAFAAIIHGDDDNFVTNSHGVLILKLAKHYKQWQSQFQSQH